MQQVLESASPREEGLDGDNVGETAGMKEKLDEQFGRYRGIPLSVM